MTTFSNQYLEQCFDGITDLSDYIHAQNVEAGWWTDLTYAKKVQELRTMGFDEATISTICSVVELSERAKRDPAGLLMLSVSELAEAMEGIRKNLMDDKLPHRKMFEVELADCIIRIFDIAGAYKLDLGAAMEEKIAYNKTRADHQVANRLKEGGKTF